ncbi:S8 family serine peptidase [Eubacterium coprostanoligenes]|uniref:S8 family serine peptidase n=1 Tax=Eubacterium coprostanoligenes TaxID=290054 RepID=UPI002354C7B3|nr:S8 family serine peptidase [Eubacterium coprostanoligenes]MCI6254900.1 S8 family serine peptidase [Eubacterium coprostanoligenes]MDY5400195.1 S8 family serine peptidase [Eubacterium coprostanoligenes]
MKKQICIFLTFLMIILAMAPCTSVLAEEARKQSVLKTSKEITALCNEYDNYSNSNDGDKIDNRLMVKTNDRIDEYGAIDSIYGFGYAFLQYADESTAKEALNNYKDSGYIADYDSLVTCMDSANHDQWGDNWAYERVDADSALDYYKLKVKSNINIAVVDSGINYNHELFKNRIIRTKYNISSTGAENDEMDDYGHGTEVSGVIANSTSSNVKISSYKIMDGSGKGNYSAVVSACCYMMELSNRPDVVNFSLGLKNGEVIMETVIDELVNSGITVVAAAGNDNREVYETPGKCENAITVAAFDYYDKPCSFTNYGGVVDISAPGEYIYTADMSNNNAYTFSLGTSLATPFVSAAAAYVLMEHKNYTPEQVKQELIATATPFKKSDCYNDRYGAGIVNFSNIINGTRCKDVTANYISGAYRDSISVELKCANTLADIYYTTDGTLPTKENGTKYTEPFTVSESERVTAVAFARAGTPFKSKFTYLDYYILKDGESEYVIEKSDYSGIIKAYLGNETNITVPDIVNGITPTELGENIFKNSNIESIVLPDTVTTIGDNAFYNTNLKSITANGICNLNKRCFYGCEQLADINFPDLRYIGTEALLDCKLLTQDLDLPFVNWVADKGLAGTYFKTINLPECTEVGASAFEGCTAQEIVLKKTTKLGAKAFYNCTNLETIYIPQATSFGGCSGCTNLKTVFAPMSKSIVTDIPSNTTIYCTGRMTGITFPQEYSDYKCTIVSPEYTAGLAAAIQDGDKDRYIHISSDEIAESKGAQIRTRDNGLRFGFSFDKNSIGFDFTKYAQSIDYGFVYTFESLDDKNAFQINDYLRENNSKVFVKSSEKRNVEGTVSTYNAVFTNIPKDHLDDKISARAYICIDGMYFYSPVITRSYSSVANAVLNDSTVSEEIKKEIENLLKNGTTQKPSLQNNQTIKKTRFTKK